MTTTQFHLGSDTDMADGTYYGIATWDTSHRDYRDEPGVYKSETAARAACDARAVGSRLVRWTVFAGSVTTRRGLR